MFAASLAPVGRPNINDVTCLLTLPVALQQSLYQVLNNHVLSDVITRWLLNYEFYKFARKVEKTFHMANLNSPVIFAFA